MPTLQRATPGIPQQPPEPPRGQNLPTGPVAWLPLPQGAVRVDAAGRALLQQPQRAPAQPLPPESPVSSYPPPVGEEDGVLPRLLRLMFQSAPAANAETRTDPATARRETAGPADAAPQAGAAWSPPPTLERTDGAMPLAVQSAERAGGALLRDEPASRSGRAQRTAAHATLPFGPAALLVTAVAALVAVIVL